MSGYSLKGRSVEAPKIYKEEELYSMTVVEIKELAAERGYSIKKTLKSEIIAEFLSQQEG